MRASSQLALSDVTRDCIPYSCSLRSCNRSVIEPLIEYCAGSFLMHSENHSYPSQVPPILQEGKDPAWKGLQQDLQLMNVKNTGTLKAFCLALCNGPKFDHCVYHFPRGKMPIN